MSANIKISNPQKFSLQADFNLDNLVMEVESYELFGDYERMLATSDSTILDDIDEDNILREDGRITLAYEDLSYINCKIAEKFANQTKILDLSNNKFKNLSFLSNFKYLNTLVLDKNDKPDEKTLPHLPKLEVLWLNNCNIDNISKWIFRLKNSCPQLKQLSLMGNPAVESKFDLTSTFKYNDYRIFVINILPCLEYLDDLPVTKAETETAKAKQDLLSVNGGSFNFLNEYNSFHNIFMFSNKNRDEALSSSNSSK